MTPLMTIATLSVSTISIFLLNFWRMNVITVVTYHEGRLEPIDAKAATLL
jgi:hypothetical protein